MGLRTAVTEVGSAGTLEGLPAELSVEGGRIIGEKLATMPRSGRPTAIVTAIDLIAIGVLQTLLAHGIRVPDDISVVGYDDISFSKQLSVPLTSVRRPHYEMGATAAELLLSAVSGELLPKRHVVFEPELIVRSSTAPMAI